MTLSFPALKRREVLLSIAATLLSVSIPGFRWLSGRHAPGTAAELIVRDRKAARAIGVRYLSLYDDENGPDILAVRLPAGCAEYPIHPTETAALRQEIQARCGRDFASSDTVIIDGWILARTEARLCALVTLTA